MVATQNHRRHAKARMQKPVSQGVQKYTLTNTTLSVNNLCQLSYTIRQERLPLLATISKPDQKRFLKDCTKTLDLASKVEGWLKGWLLPSTIPIVNSMSINLKLSGTRKLNSCLIVAPRGSGKSELLERTLAASNPDHFVVLPPKIFESELVTKSREFFHNKVIVADDLIVSFEGMSTKQRQQLVNFWTKLLEGSYARDKNTIENTSTVVLFGLASEQLDRFRDELLSSTFLDRVPPFKHNVTTEMKRGILKFRALNQRRKLARVKPIIKLPLPEKIEDNKKVNIAFPYSKEVEDRIVEYAMELDSYGVQSSARAQDYVKTFMRANALLNGRRKVTKSDLYLYDLVHPLFLNSMGELGTENRVLALIKNHPHTSDKELIEIGDIAKGTFYKYKKILQRKGLI